MPDMTNGMWYWVVSFVKRGSGSALSNVAQVLSVGYRAGFGHWNKGSPVTANSPGTVTSPQNLGGSGTQLCGHRRSLSAQLNGTSPV